MIGEPERIFLFFHVLNVSTFWICSSYLFFLCFKLCSSVLFQSGGIEAADACCARFLSPLQIRLAQHPALKTFTLPDFVMHARAFCHIALPTSMTGITYQLVQKIDSFCEGVGQFATRALPYHSIQPTSQFYKRVLPSMTFGFFLCEFVDHCMPVLLCHTVKPRRLQICPRTLW